MSYVQGQRAFRGWLTGHGIQLVKTVDNGMVRNDDNWEHFSYTLTVSNRYAEFNNPTYYEFPYKQGVGITSPPKVIDIMSALLNDAQSVVNEPGFTDWAESLGYDVDSRAAEAIYQQIKANNAKLCKLFRTTDLEALLDAAQPLMEAAGL